MDVLFVDAGPAERNRCRTAERAHRKCLCRRPNCPTTLAPDRADTQDRSIDIRLTVNGRAEAFSIAPWVTLLDLLRDRMDLTGTKKGCDHGQCGACTVLIDGRRVNSCLTLAVVRDGAEIETIEGLANGRDLHPLQQAFIDHDAFQCGYCTPGQICSAIGMLREGRATDREAIRENMSGNLCRCGAYTNIVDAIEAVQDREDAR